MCIEDNHLFIWKKDSLHPSAFSINTPSYKKKKRRPKLSVHKKQLSNITCWYLFVAIKISYNLQPQNLLNVFFQIYLVFLSIWFLVYFFSQRICDFCSHLILRRAISVIRWFIFIEFIGHVFFFFVFKMFIG